MRIPAGSTVGFYALDGAALSDEDGAELLATLRGGGQAAPVEQVAAGASTYDYAFWGQPGDARVGIFPATGGSDVGNLWAPTPERPLFLSEVLLQHPGDLLFVCCRTTSDPALRRGCAVPAGGFPAPPS